MRFLENLCLLLVTALIVLGGYNYIKSQEKSKEETPIVDVVPGDEDTLKLDIYDNTGESVVHTIEYEEGMTWAEWLESDYNKVGFSTAGPTSNPILIDTNSIQINDADGNGVVVSSVIDATIKHRLGV